MFQNAHDIPQILKYESICLFVGMLNVPVNIYQNGCIWDICCFLNVIPIQRTEDLKTVCWFIFISSPNEAFALFGFI